MSILLSVHILSESFSFTLQYLNNIQLFDIPLTQYLLLSRNVETTYMPPQEYLDRQDRYNLIFFLDSTNDPQQPYICLQMKVNGWMIRINNAELDK